MPTFLLTGELDPNFPLAEPAANPIGSRNGEGLDLEVFVRC